MEAPESKMVKTQQMVPMAQMGAEMLMLLGEESATKQGPKVHLHSGCSLPGVDSAVILARATQAEGQSTQAAGLGILLHRRIRVHWAISTLHRPVLLELLQVDPQTSEATLLQTVAEGLRLARPQRLLAWVAGSD